MKQAGGYGLTKEQADILTRDKALADYFERCVKAYRELQRAKAIRANKREAK